MPDFDPKSIPTLDDVIDTIESEDIEKDNSSVETEPAAMDDEPALFTAEPVIAFTTDIDDESIEDEATEAESNIDESIEFSSTDPDSNINSDFDSKAEIIESALIDYNAKHDDNSSIEDNITEADEITSKIDTPPEASIEPPTELQPLITPIALQTITDDIVNQLMPELEQRLRILIHQSLEEKLPPDVISPKLTTNTNIED